MRIGDSHPERRQDPWFATSRFPYSYPWVRSLEDGSGLVHAKRVGTPLTACGLNTESWVKHWTRFESVAVDSACSSCVLATSAPEKI